LEGLVGRLGGGRGEGTWPTNYPAPVLEGSESDPENFAEEVKSLRAQLGPPVLEHSVVNILHNPQESCKQVSCVVL